MTHIEEVAEFGRGIGVAGSPDYGNDSPLCGAVGFVRKSEKKSGLTRKKKPTP